MQQKELPIEMNILDWKGEWIRALSAYLNTKQIAKGRIFVTGLGGSGLAGELLKHITNGKIVYSKTPSAERFDWIVAISYSGNTWETISVIDKMKKSGAKVLAITSGGKLSQSADAVVPLPTGMMARDAFPFIIAAAMSAAGCKKELKDAIGAIKKANLDGVTNITKRIYKKVPVIYASEEMIVAAKRFKQQLNENAKMFAFFSKMPDSFHNDTEPFFWPNQKFIPIVLEKYPEKMTANPMPKAIMIKTSNKSMVAKMVDTMFVLDYVSIMLARKSKVDRYASRRYEK